eukprot:950443-Lingulodinium_polyedra.AAC.1
MADIGKAAKARDQWKAGQAKPAAKRGPRSKGLVTSFDEVQRFTTPMASACEGSIADASSPCLISTDKPKMIHFNEEPE